MFLQLTPRQASMPSLTALRAFEAMARTGQATRAADELYVTHSAVSRQVKALEATLGVKLFAGPKHRLELTAAGEMLAHDLEMAFDAIAAAVGWTRAAGHVLTVAVNASASVKWLIPRLPDFMAKHPDITVQLTELAPHALSQRGADIVIRLLGPEQIEATRAIGLLPSAIGPVLSPELAARFAGPAVLTAPRLSVRTHPSGWRDWAALRKLSLPAAPEATLAHLHFALDAAVAGLGVAMLPWPLAAGDVATGRLCAPLGFEHDGSALVAIRASSAPKRPADRFTNWLKAQGALMTEAPSGQRIV